MSKKRMLPVLAILACALPSLATAAMGEQKPADGAEQKMQASILIVDSPDAMSKWVKNPKGGDTGRARSVTIGQKILFPVVVTGLKTTDFGQPGIVADMQFISPDGKVMFDSKKWGVGANRGDPRTPGLVVLVPVIDLTFEPGDPLGTYEVRATVTYGARTASASEKFALITGAGEKPAAANQGRTAQAGVAKPKKRAARAADMRSCLDRDDDAAVIRCVEKFR